MPSNSSSKSLYKKINSSSVTNKLGPDAKEINNSSLAKFLKSFKFME